MRISRETLKAEADALRKRAAPIWAALEDFEGHERDQGAFKSSIEHLEQQRLCITVMGEFNSGKSTLLNTFIGEELLPTDQLECTAVPTWVRRADDESLDENRQATVIYANGSSDAMPLSEVSAHTTLDRDSWKKIERVEITLPKDEGEQGPTNMVLVDTPGLNGNKELETRSIHQLGMSHVTIVVVPVGGIELNHNVELIKKARSIADRVMVVINKCDKLAKTGDGFEKFRNALRRLVPDLPHEAIYTVSAKRAFNDNAYQDGEDELESEFYRFYNDLQQNVLEDPTAALKKRPLLLLSEICKKEIARIEKLEAEFDTSIVKELEAAEVHLKEAQVNLQRSQKEIIRLSRKTLMGEVGIFQRFLNKERSHIEQKMTKFVDEELDDELLNRDDLRAAQQCVSEWLNGSMQSSIFNRVSSLLKAAANRLIYDLENRGQDSALNLPKVASIKLDMAPLKQQADKASEALSRREDEIDGLKQRVTRCKRAVKRKEKKVETLGLQSAQLENLEAQRKKAVRDRTQLGPKPNPKMEDYTAYETREVKRRGLMRMWDLFSTKKERVRVTRQRKNYSHVRKWERESEAADKKISGLKKKIALLKDMRTKMQKIRDELPKLLREAKNTKAKLEWAEKCLLEEQEKYRQVGIKARQSQLKAGARRELESLFDSLPDRLSQEAKEMLERISEDFSQRFKKTADQRRKLLADEMVHRKKEAYEEDAERVKREDIRKTLEKALETFLSEGQGERT